MVITRTPFRISFFGGGTDYPVYFRENGGAVLSTTIDKYCYISCRYLPPFFEHKSRIVWSKIESVRKIQEIEHPAVRASLRYMRIREGLEIHHDGDLPARTGLGSSSSFTVGLLNSLYALKGKITSKKKLAEGAIHIEQDLMRENVGSQDQVVASYGGFNKIEFHKNGKFEVTPLTLSTKRIEELENHLMLVFTGFARHASEIAREQIKATPGKIKVLKRMKSMVDEAIKILNSKKDITDFGKLLHESWELKRSLTKKISTSFIDEIYNKGLKAGATGGKLLGAGGGGFLLLFIQPEKRLSVKKNLSKLLEVPFHFENLGSQIIFYQPTPTIYS